jgi:hypothetical protein
MHDADTSRRFAPGGRDLSRWLEAIGSVDQLVALGATEAAARDISEGCSAAFLRNVVQQIRTDLGARSGLAFVRGLFMSA